MRLRTTWILFSGAIKCCDGLWPSPESYEHGSSVCWLSTSVSLIHEQGQLQIWHQLLQMLQPLKGNARQEEGILIGAAFLRLQEDIRAHSFVPWKFHPKNADFEPKFSLNDSFIDSIRVEKGGRRVDSHSQEAYSLQISEDCQVLVQINHPLGAIRAFNTFTQLFHAHSEHWHGMPYMKSAPAKISDTPAFEHRGLNLDISRNIVSPKDVMRMIDALAFCKFNRLHLHASDAQSWPLEIPSIPELATKGAYHKSQIWSVADLYEVEKFGARMGVEVYLEIDMPGHTASIQESFPELITSFNRKPWEVYSAQPPSGQLDLNSSAVHAFVDTLLSDLLPRTKPFTPLFHLGGDEITAAAYNITPAQLKPYLQAFVDHAISLVRGHGLTPIVWEEQILDFNLSLPSNTIIQTWRGSTTATPRSSFAELIGRGHRTLFGSNDYWYLDCGHGTWIGPDNGNHESRVKPPFLDYCAPYKNWRRVLSYDPLADIPESQRHLVVGGEVHLWGELTDGQNLDSMLWPRVAAAGEVLWRGKGVVGEKSTRALAEMREWLVQKGVGSGPVQVTWCLMNPGNCVA